MAEQRTHGADAYDRPYVPGIPCMECGRFVGRDGSIEIEHMEMSSTWASVEGTCARCIAATASSPEDRP